MDTVSSETARQRAAGRRGEDRGAPRGKVQRPQHAEEHLQPDERPEATAPCRKNGGEGEPGDEAERLRGEQHAAPMRAVRHDAGERPQRHHRGGAREGGQPHHER
jgi:hypothetical protein